jgi:archaellum component FlaC
VDEKASKAVVDNLVKDHDELHETVKQLIEHVNKIKAPKPVDNTNYDDKFTELERMLLALETKFDRIQDSVNQRMNDINKFMDLIKDDVDRSLEEHEQQVLKVVRKVN